MSVEFYYWPLTMDPQTNIGHAALMAGDGTTAGSAYLSTWPSSTASVVYGGGYQHDYQQDCAAEGSNPAVIHYSKLDDASVKAAIEAIQKDASYSLIVGNCATQVGSALRTGTGLFSIQTLLDVALSTNPIIGFLTFETPWLLYRYALSLQPIYG